MDWTSFIVGLVTGVGGFMTVLILGGIGHTCDHSNCGSRYRSHHW